MRKKILVLGGSYFFGRWFVEFAHNNHDLTIVNRGNIPVNIHNVKEITADRHDKEALNQLAGQSYDLCVDFCAYAPGDIETIVNIPGLTIKRYIFISTVDVYKRMPGVLINTACDLTDEFPEGPEGDYIKGKVNLEKEIASLRKQHKIEFTSIRPTILYGPANYAEREGTYFNWIKTAGEVINPIDATGFFQLTYVGDAARVLVKICEMDEAPEILNLCGLRIDSYRSFLDALGTIPDVTFKEIDISVSDMLNQNIILPFPVLKEYSQAYKGLNYADFGVVETDLSKGLEKAYKLY